MMKAFDDRVKEMSDVRVQVQMFIASQVCPSSTQKRLSKHSLRVRANLSRRTFTIDVHFL